MVRHQIHMSFSCCRCCYGLNVIISTNLGGGFVCACAMTNHIIFAIILTIDIYYMMLCIRINCYIIEDNLTIIIICYNENRDQLNVV